MNTQEKIDQLVTETFARIERKLDLLEILVAEFYATEQDPGDAVASEDDGEIA